MKTYNKSHWVTDQAVTGSTDFDTMGAIASDLSESTGTLTELVAHYLSSGATPETTSIIRNTMDKVFEEFPTKGDEPQYHQDQVRSSYVLALAAADLAHFMSSTAEAMMEHGDSHGYVNE